MVRSLRVAVIGAGFSGLLAARELQSEGHQVVVFEKNDRVGGTWVYEPRVETDPLGLDPDREIVHSSLYHSLRTNLPRQLMGFSDYPFLKKENGDSRAYPGHEEVLSFLNDFARDFKLLELIRFGSEVIQVERVSERKDEWVVEWKTRGKESEAEVFEAVIVCNGHNSQPRLAEFAGMDKWPGKQIHSHNYRTHEQFQDQIVVLIGAGPSAIDISKEISKVAKEIHLASRTSTIEVGKLDYHDNIWQHSMIESVHEDSKVIFQDGSSVHADVIIHCTGYKYHFPFLETNGIVSVDDNRVGPLYKHVFPPLLAPWLSFIGLANRVHPTLIMELLSKWVAQVLSGKLQLPTEEEMMASVEEFDQQMEESGRPKHNTYTIHPHEFEYRDWLIAQMGLPPTDKGIDQMYVTAIMNFINHHQDGSYREKWDEEYWIQQSKSSNQR